MRPVTIAFWLVAFALIALFSWNACGTSNDQGISFRIAGFYDDAFGANHDPGRTVDLNTVDAVPNDCDGDGSLDGGFIALQNTLTQGVAVQRVDLSYRVTGSSLSFPNDAAGLTTKLGPSSGQEPAAPPASFTRVQLAGPQIFQFMNQNRTRLPEPPFAMIISAVAVGVTDAGDVIRSNAANYQVSLVDAGPVPCNGPPAEPCTGCCSDHGGIAQACTGGEGGGNLRCNDGQASPMCACKRCIGGGGLPP